MILTFFSLDNAMQAPEREEAAYLAHTMGYDTSFTSDEQSETVSLFIYF